MAVRQRKIQWLTKNRFSTPTVTARKAMPAEPSMPV